MPLYDYQCDECNAVFEVEHRMSDSRRRKCPACGSTRTTKVFNAAGIVFKGSGFYVTDSKNGSSAATPPAPSEPAAKPADSPNEATTVKAVKSADKTPAKPD